MRPLHCSQRALTPERTAATTLPVLCNHSKDRFVPAVLPGKIVMFERTSSSPCEAVQQTSLERVTIEIAGARVPTNRVRTSPTSSLDTGRCVAMPRRDALPAPPHWSHSAAVASLGLHTAAAACIQLYHLATSRVPLRALYRYHPSHQTGDPVAGASFTRLLFRLSWLALNLHTAI